MMTKHNDQFVEILNLIITEDNKRLLDLSTDLASLAIDIAQNFPWLKWQTSTTRESSAKIKENLKLAHIKNILSPIEYSPGKNKLPQIDFDVFLCANTLESISWKNAKTFFKNIGDTSYDGTQLIIYGPLLSRDKDLSEEMEFYDNKLKKENLEYGIRSFEKICEQLKKVHFQFTEKFNLSNDNVVILFTKIELI
ncbi:MAG: hypothetical protein ACI9QD_000693 [Thermoproteota archaeon]|jgi:hypothetical protein